MSSVEEVPTFRILVATPTGRVTFVIAAHLAVMPVQQLIEPDFYIRFSRSLSPPRGPHYELEVLEPVDMGQTEHIHVHVSKKNERKFVCWSGHLPTLQHAKSVLWTWCLGTAYTMVTGENFVLVLNRVGEDAFFAETCADYEIDCVDDPSTIEL